MKSLPLILLLLALLAGLYYSYVTWRDNCVDSNSFWCNGEVDWQKVFPPAPPPTQPPPEPTAPPPEATGPAPYPSSPATPDDAEPAPPPVATAPPAPVPGPPPYAPPPETTKLVAFYEGKANLTAPALSILRDAAMRAMETERQVRLRLDALGPREEDDDLWRRRLQAVKDELVRLGVPADRVAATGDGPFELTIRQRAVPQTRTQRERVTMELIPDPLAGDFE